MQNLVSSVVLLKVQGKVRHQNGMLLSSFKCSHNHLVRNPLAAGFLRIFEHFLASDWTRYLFGDRLQPAVFSKLLEFHFNLFTWIGKQVLATYINPSIPVSWVQTSTPSSPRCISPLVRFDPASSRLGGQCPDPTNTGPPQYLNQSWEEHSYRPAIPSSTVRFGLGMESLV